MSVDPKKFGLSKSLIDAVNETLHPNQKKLDVAEPKGKLDAQDFKKLRGEGSKPDFLDLDKDGNKTEPMKKASKEIKEDDAHFAQQSKKMQDAINMHLRKGKSYADAAKAAKMNVKEELDLEENKLYHVSWGSGREHQVVAKHGEEAVSKAKDAIIKKIPKLQDKKYSDAFDKKPTVTDLSHERKVQKDRVQEEIEEGFVVRYNNPKSEKHGSEKHFDDQAAAKKHATRGNFIDKVGGKYTVHKTNEKGHDVKEEALDELSKTTLGSYAGKAATQRDDSRDKQGRLSVPVKDREAHSKLAFKRAQGVKKAISKLGEESLDEKAVSQAQQKAAGAALATQRGEYAGGKKGGAVNRMALMKAAELRKIAATKRTGLPMRKEETELDEADSYSIKNTKTDNTYHISKYPITSNHSIYKKIKAKDPQAQIHKNGQPMKEEVVSEADDAIAKQIATKKDAMQKQIRQKIAQKQMSVLQQKAQKKIQTIKAGTEKCSCGSTNESKMKCEVHGGNMNGIKGGKEAITVNPPLREASKTKY